MPSQGPNIAWCDECGKMIRGNESDIDWSMPVNDCYQTCDECDVKEQPPSATGGEGEG